MPHRERARHQCMWKSPHSSYLSTVQYLLLEPQMDCAHSSCKYYPVRFNKIKPCLFIVWLRSRTLRNQAKLIQSIPALYWRWLKNQKVMLSSCHEKMDCRDVPDCCSRVCAANSQSIRAGKRAGRRSEAARAIRRGLGSRQDVLPYQWETDCNERHV